MQNFLSEIGLSSNEALVYLELLKIGPQLVSVLANRLSFNRSSTYSLLKSLISKGLVSVFKKDGLNYFSSNDPNNLIAYLDSKSRFYQFYKEQTLSLIPNLRKLSSNLDIDKTLITLYDGVESMNNLLLSSALKTNFLYSFVPFEYSDTNSYGRFFIETDLLFGELSEMEFRVISLNKPSNLNFSKQFECFSHMNKAVKFLNFDIADDDSKNILNIYSEKIVLFSLLKGAENAVEIKSKSFANLLKTLFTCFWNLKNN